MPTMLDDIARMKDILNSAEQHAMQSRYFRTLQKLYELAVVTREYDRPPSDKPAEPAEPSDTDVKVTTMNQNDLISQCLKITGLANEAQNSGSIAQAQYYLAKLRKLLNEQPELDAVAADEPAEPVDTD